MLKTKTIKTDKATLFVVELPEGAKFIRIETNQAVVPYGQEVNYEVPATKESYGYEETEGFALPEGNWQLLGRLPDITEDQWGEIVEDASYKYPYEFTRKYENYNEGDFDFNCSSESALSLLQLNEVYFENPLGDEPKITSGEYDDNGFGDIDKHQFKIDLKSWQESQSKVWDKERCFLFLKIE